MIFLQDLGEYDLADENFLDVQSITDAMMTTTQSLTELAIRFFLNLAVCWVIVGLFYYRKSRRRDYYFTFMVFSTAMLMLLYIMGNVEVGVGLTLGLFAIFGVIRYRTETVAMNGLAPLYRVAGALSDNPHYALNTGALLVTVISNLLVIGLIWFLESDKVTKHTSTKLVLYDRIELIVPERRAELVADLEKRLGLKIDNVEIGHVDFLKDAAFIKVFYTLGHGETGSIDQLTRAKDYVEQ